MNENENTTTQNLWDTVKAVVRGKFIAIQAYLKEPGKSQINNLTLYLKQLEKEEMKKPRVSRRKNIFLKNMYSKIHNLTLHLKQLEKEKMKNPRVTRRKEILKIRAEINAKETKETITKINKAKSWFFQR